MALLDFESVSLECQNIIGRYPSQVVKPKDPRDIPKSA
jgi:hypothetical protein